DHRGSVAIPFAVMLFGLVFLAGVGIDSGRGYSAKGRLQSAVDAAVLAASNVFVEDDKREPLFQEILKQNLANETFATFNAEFRYTRASGGLGQVTAALPVTLLAITGKESLDIKVESSAQQIPMDLEIVFVLDVSGSMRAAMGGETRMDALKRAAKRTVDMLDKVRMPGQNIRFGIVPFTMNVNIGTRNDRYVSQTNNALFTGTNWAGCVLERPAPHHHRDTYTGGVARDGGRWHAYIAPPEPNSSSKCQNPSNGTNTGYRSIDPVGPAGPFDSQTKGPNFNCVRHPIVELSNDALQIAAEIDALTPVGNMGTIVAPGVGWGHRLLSPEEPFTDGAPFSGSVRKMMIVITDGEQTTEGPWVGGRCTGDTNTTSAYQFNPATFGLDGATLNTTGPSDMFSPYGYMLDSNPMGGGAASSWSVVDDQMEALTLNACDEFKARDTGSKTVELFTIAASNGAAPGTRVHTILQKCASTNRHFFFANDAAALDEAFMAITREVTKLSLTD
ncbi:MAG: pilus assembly protein TadG-related protein, partial [Vicinamibacterales bacterium]